MKRYFEARPRIRIIFGIFFFLALLAINAYAVILQSAPLSVFVLAFIPALNLLNEFSPDLYSALRSRFGPSPYSVLVRSSLGQFRLFLQEYFLITLSESYPVPSDIPLFNALDNLIQAYPSPLSKNENTDRRRRQLIPPLFVALKFAELGIDVHENIQSYIKAQYRALSAKGKDEFVYAFSQLVLLQRKFGDIELYFDPPSNEELQRSRLQFFDRYLKDDYLDELTNKLKFKESQIRSFRSSLEAVAKSGKFNLDHLKRFVAKKRNYRKLFIVTSDTNLPGPVQTYIRQNPHFILNWASIANLPRIGLSKRFDIFFFSPRESITSAGALLKRLISLSAAVQEHPIRIYTVDPIEGIGSSMARNPHFQQAIAFFEEGAIDTSAIHELTQDQILALLENSNIPLRDLIREIPPAEFSPSIVTPEKDVLNKIFAPIIKVPNGSDVFRGISQSDAILARARGLKAVPTPYNLPDLREQLGGAPTILRVRKRILALSQEVLVNLEIIQGMLP